MGESLDRPGLEITNDDRQDAANAVATGFIEFDFYKRLVRIKNVGEHGEKEEAAKLFEALPDPLSVLMPEKD